MRVLVVEDEALLRRQLSDRLAREGWRVDASGDGAEGLYQAVEKTEPDSLLAIQEATFLH
jgi:two-component system response regulator PhoP